MTTEDEQAYLSVDQVATRYGVTKHSIWQWMKRGLIPQPVRFTPRCSRWPIQRLQEWEATLEEQRAHRRVWDRQYSRSRRPPMRRTRWPQ